ncbi:MAG TPA: DUF4062 domain-containing protein [Pyrinomonadaceae bacterium]|jgi:hypothetical protein
MAKIYISSTYSDLKDYREEVCHALRRLGHDVVAMEDYTASDQRPLEKCLADVDGCDVYIGIFAWRYGYIPPNQEKSITELEFRTAANKKICLLFLLDDNAPWSRTQMDKDSGRIEALRDELKRDFLVEFFSNKDELASDITIAVSKALASKENTAGGAVTGNGGKENNDGMKELWKMLRPIIVFFIAVIAICVLAMISFAIPSVQSSVNVQMGLTIVVSILIFAVVSFTFITYKFINKFVQIAREA